MENDNDKTRPAGASGATPNRDKPRQAPIIDARPGDVKEVKATEEPAKSSTAPGSPQAQAAAASGKTTEAQAHGKNPAGAAESGTPPPKKVAAPAPAPYAAMAGAGVAGAILAVLGAWAFGLGGNGSSVVMLDKRVQTVESAQSTQKAALDAAGKSLSAVGELEKRLTALEAALKQQAAVASTLKTDVGKLSAAPVVQPPDLKPLETRLAALEKLVNEAKSSVRATADPDTRAQTQGSATTLALAGTVARLETRLAALEKKVQPAADLAPLNARIDAVAKQVAPLEARIATSLTPVAQAIARTDQKITASIGRSNAAARAIIARALADKVRAGQPFSDELAAAAATGADAQQIGVLQPMAGKGAPSQAALLNMFTSLESGIVQAPKPAADASLVERLKQGTLGLVKIRPVDSDSGETPGALFVRIRKALATGNFSEALTLHEKLPEEARKHAGAFAQTLGLRIEADKAINAIAAQALAELRKQKS